MYDFKSFGEDEDLIKKDRENYCLKQVYKMCYYVSHLYQHEILQMKCEFLIDFHGSIWFIHASDIYARFNKKAKEEKEKHALRI